MTRRLTGGVLVSFWAIALAAAGARAEDLVFTAHTWTKFSSGFTNIRQTTTTGRYSFDVSACSERYVGTAEITVPESVSGKIVGTNFIPDTPFKVSATYTVNYTAGESASYRLTIDTYDDVAATTRCSRRGDVTSVAPGPHPLTWSQECTIDKIDVSFSPSLRTGFDLTTFNKTGICGDTIYAETAFKVVASSGSTLSGAFKRSYGGKTYWVPDAPIELIDAAGNVAAKTYLRTDPANTAKSWYRMALPAGFDFNKDYRLHVTLQSDPDPSLAKLKLFATLTDAKPLEIYTTPFRIASGAQSATKDVNVDRASGDIPAAGAVTAEAAVETYWNVWRQLYVLLPFVDDRKLTYNLPLEVYLNAASTYYCVTAGLPTCPAASSIALQPRDSLPGADPSVLWHEFGHYMMSEIHGGRVLPPAFRNEDAQRIDAIHNGYANSYSTRALEDGFATFWSWMSSDVLDSDHTPQLYYNRISEDGTRATRDTGYASEWNWAAWDVRRSANGPADLPRGEEFAIAALLWDLYDKESDDEATTRATWTFGGSRHTPVDTLSFSADSILTIFHDRKPRTALELYNALKAALPSAATSLSGNPRNSGLTQLDELFVMQGIFADANGNWTYDYGEAVGKPSNSAAWSGGLASGAPVDVPPRPWRENVPRVPNSFVTLTLPAQGATATVSYNFGPGLEKLSSSRQLPLTSGDVYLEMPSPHYPMELIISVPGSPPLRLDNQVYWLLPRDRPLGSFMIAPASGSAPVVSSLGASSALTGAPVTINGTNFSTNPYNDIVRFGGVLGFVTEATATRLVAVTPPIAPGSAPITVEVNGRVSTAVPFSIADTASCRYFVDTVGTSFTGRGGASRIFTYTKPSCAWTIASQTSWIALDRPGSHAGNLAVELSVQPNPTTQPRTGTIVINGSALTVYEEAGGATKPRAAKH